MSEPGEDTSSFTATRWTVVRRAQGPSPQSRQALAELCQIYRKPVFRFIRCEGRGDDEAQELTQEFFARLLSSGRIGAASHHIGKFRSYLLGAVKHFLADQRKAEQRQKRGGGAVHVRLESEAGADGQVPDPASSFDETYFDRQWAYALLDRVLARLEDEFRESGRIRQFESLKPWLMPSSSTDAKQSLPEGLDLSPGALKVAVHRMRKRYRALMREELADTVTSEAEATEELHYLVEVLSNHPQET